MALLIRSVAALAVVAALSSPAAAQIVNVQSMLATEAPEGLSGSITGAADWRTGNVNLISLAAGPLARYRTGDHLFIATWRGELKMIKATPDADEHEEFVKKSFAHARYRFSISDQLLGEAFAQHEFDQFRRIKLRFVTGAGAKYDLVETKAFRLSAALAYMFEYEGLSDGYFHDEDLEDDVQVHHRASSYVVVGYKLDEKVDIADTLYLQPRLDDPGDFRLLNDSELVVNVTEKVSLKTTFSIAFDSEPPFAEPDKTDVEDLDTTLETSITIKF